MFECNKCGKESYLLYFLRKEEQSSRLDNKEYCKQCFDKEYKDKQNDKNDKE